MRATLIKEYRFEAAQTLPTAPEGHKCRGMHGHSFKIEIAVTGKVDPQIGWVYDHALISKAMNPLIDLLDHSYLNEIEGLENPTSEILAMWIWDRAITNLPMLSQVSVRETCTSGCNYRGPS